MVRVEFKGTANRCPVEIVDGNKTVREYLQSKGAMMQSTFTVSGTNISDKLDLKLSELVSAGIVSEGMTITIYETIKTSNASC